MGLTVQALIAAFGGGLLGACMGGLPTITLWGAVLMIAGTANVATGNAEVLWAFGFNPLIGAQCAFIGGASAACYAWRIKRLPSGQDISKPLSSLQRVDVLCFGGIAGVLGLCVQSLGEYFQIPTDNVALSVVVIGWLTRFALDPHWLSSRKEALKNTEGYCGFFPKGKDLATLLFMGFFIGFGGGLASYMMGNNMILFGLALVFIIYIQTGFGGYTWHHMVLIGSTIGVQTGGSLYGLFWAGIMAAVTGVICRCIENLTMPGTNSYIDPPVTSIAIGTSLTILITSLGII